MTPALIRRPPPLLRRLANVWMLLALTTLVACGTRLTPTIAHVPGHAVEVVEVGAGDATVVFESGLGDDWAPWDRVAGAVASRARVFAYSRPGYGHSDPSDAPRTATRIVEDLRTLLAARGFAPPYIVVGHSFGGTYMELFAKAHPDEVLGLVLVDSRPRDFTAACQAVGLDGCTIPASAVSSLSKVEQNEFRAFASTSDEIRAAGAFGRYPVRVLTATSHRSFDPTAEALWKSIHGSLAKEASHGEQILFEGAGHYLQIDRAQEVAEVILSLVPASKI